MSDPDYKAFISYSHADEAWARWLHRALEGYRVPRRLIGRETGLGRIPARLFPVFRDRDELGSGHELGEEVRRALRHSRTLVVICSPRSAASRWVNEEIRYFKSLGRAHRVVCLIVDGNPGSPDGGCFAPALLHELDAEGQPAGPALEPMAADARAVGDGRARARLKVLAGILDVPYDELRQRELLARNRRLAALSLVSCTIAAVTAGLALLADRARDEAQRQRQIAEAQQLHAEQQRKLAHRRQQQAERLVEFMLGDLRKRLEPIGRLELLDAIGDEAMAYFAAVDPGTLTDDELGARARALRQVGDVRARQGRLAEASPAFAESLRLDSERVARRPDDTQAVFDVAQSQFYIGYDHYLRGEHQRALPWFQRYAASADRLLELEPDEPRWQRERQYALDTLASINTALGDYPACIAAAEAALAWTRELQQQRPRDEALREVEASSLFKAASCDWYPGRIQAQLDRMQQVQPILDAMLAAAPDSRPRQFQVAAAQATVGASRMELGQLDRAGPFLQSARQTFADLARFDPDNVTWSRELAASEVRLAEWAILSGDPDRADRRLSALVARLEAMPATLPDADTWLRALSLRLLLAEQRRDRAASDAVTAQIGARLASASPSTAARLACALMMRSNPAGPAPTVCAQAVPVRAESSRLRLVVEAMTTAPAEPWASDAGRRLQARGYRGAAWHLLNAGTADAR